MSLFGLVLNYTNKLLIYLWVQIVPLPLITDLFLLCYETLCCLFCTSIRSVIIEASNSTSRYLDHVLNINNECLEQVVDKIYSKELQLKNKQIRVTP